MVGNILGNRYEVLERIGTGGMSLVYRARDITLNRLVAVKILKHQWAEDDEVVRRFEQEARAAASLVDRHIVQVYDVGRDEPDIHYMVMELVGGETLRAKLDREAPLATNTAMEIADQVAQGLEMAHARKLVHRDIKPQNVLIAPQGDVKVTDFGIAYAATTGTLVNTGSLLGTVQYLSPEQARGKLIGPQSDLYSLGVVLFEMLTGKLPFESDSAIGVAIKHLQDEPPRIDALRPEVPSQVADIVERALSKDPAERYQSAHALRQDIGRFLHPQVESQEPQTVAAVPQAALPRRTGRTADKPPEAEPKRTRKWLPYAIVAAVVVLLAAGTAFAFNRWINPPLEGVPNVHGQTVAAARRVLQQRHLSVQVGGRASSNTVPANHVLRENPSAGTRVKPGQSVVLLLSSGPNLVRVPGLARDNESLAKQSLKILGFKVHVSQIASSLPKGEVARQSPRGGKKVPEGSTVKLWVSNASKQATGLMPNLIGFTVSQASGLLVGDNVTMTTAGTTYSTQPMNTIIDQSPAPYSSLPGVESVSVTVSSGPTPISKSLLVNHSIVRIPIPPSVSPKSLLKIVVTDDADNQEVDYQQVNPGQTIEYPVLWYGNGGQLLWYINGQAQAPRPLVPTTPTSSPPPSSSPSTPPSNSGSPSSPGAS